MNNFGEFVIVDDREWQDELAAVFRAGLEKVRFRTDRGGHCGNDFFSDRVGLRTYAPELVHHLETHYEMKYTVGREDFVHLVRRPEPIAPPPVTAVLPLCDTDRGYQTVREHLLFPALYHDPGTGSEMPSATIETPCDVPVPEGGATFAVRVDYRAPATVEPGTTLTTEVLVVGAEFKRRMASKAFRVAPQTLDAGRVAFEPELRVDLDEWAGGNVRLLLRTIRRGRVIVQPFERTGFGTVWQDPRLILRDPPAPPRTRASPRGR